MPLPGSKVYLRSLLILLGSACLACVFATPSAAQDTSSAKKDTAIAIAPAGKSGSLDKPIDYQATDSIIFDIRQNKVYLYRDAELLYGSIHLTAYYIEVDITKKEIFATGGLDSLGHYSYFPVLKDGNDQYTADSMRYNSNSKKGRVYGLRLVQDDDIHIHLGTVLKQSDGSFAGEKGKITTCNADHPHFYFNTTKIKVIPNKKVVFGPADLVVEDVPTPLAVPFGLAPVKKGRVNGILMPSPGYNAFNGTFFLQNLGYYRGLGPNADITIRGDAYLNGDLRVGITSNFVKLYKFRSNIGLNASWFGNSAERTSPEFQRTMDFSVTGGFQFDPKYLPGTTLNGNLNIQTGNYNKLNARTLNGLAQNQFNSSINYGRGFLNNKITLSSAARHSQNTSDRSFRIELPSMTLGVPSITPFGNIQKNSQILKQLRFSYNMNFNNVLQTYDSVLFSTRGKEEFKNIQNGINHSLPVSTNFKLFKGVLNFSPSFSYNEIWYFKAQTQTLDTGKKIKYHDTQGFFRLSKWGLATSMTTNIYGTFKNVKMGNLRGLRHTVSPTITFGYDPEISSLKLGHQRTYLDTSRTDSIVKYNIFDKGIYRYYEQLERGYIGFNINNNLQAKKVVSIDSNGKEEKVPATIIDGLSIGGSYNILADSFNWSDLSLGLNTVLLKHFNIHLDAVYSPYAVDANKRKINQFAWKYNKELLHFQSFNAQFNTKLSPETFKKEKIPTPKRKLTRSEEAELEEIRRNPDNYYNMNIPWTLSVNYNFTYSNDVVRKIDRVSRNNINFRLDLNVTPEWKVGFGSGYDLKDKTLSRNELSVTRNLHCWMIEFNWIPGQLWMFSLRPKSGLLQDLKLNKKVANQASFYL